MPFSENVKLEVKEKSAFKCCRCQNVGVQVHHIMPVSKGGSDDFDNAAPLCPSCHDYFGGNPDKRKEIREMCDWWYKIVEENYRPKKKLMDTLGNISTNFESISNDRTNEQEKLRKCIVTDMYHLLLESEIVNIDEERFKQVIGTTVTASTSVTSIKK